MGGSEPRSSGRLAPTAVAVPARLICAALAHATLSCYPTRELVRDAGGGRVARDQELGHGAGARCAPEESSGLVVGGGGEEAPLRFAFARTMFAR